MNYAVVMAGGSGKRLWPLSRQKRPKQVLRLLEGQTCLRHCFDRLLNVFDLRNVIVMTNASYMDIIRESLPELPSPNMIAEPVVRDTASAIALAAAALVKTDPNATMAVVTADQLIKPAEVLQQALRDAIAFVNKNPEAMLTFGIKPTFPSTQLGYIKCDQPQTCGECTNTIYTVEAFREKPDSQTAQEYLDSGKFLWNSGMFVWKAKTILSHIEKFLPQAVEPLRKIQAAWNTPDQQRVLWEYFPKLPKISIDFAVMEKAEKVYAIKLDCHWLDMGSFSALADIVTSDQNNNIVV